MESSSTVQIYSFLVTQKESIEKAGLFNAFQLLDNPCAGEYYDLKEFLILPFAVPAFARCP